MNRFSLLTCLLALLLGASACSSGASDSGIALGADGEATSTVAANVRGAIYVNTTTGDLLTVDPGRESAGVLWRTEDNGQLPVFEVAPADNATGLFVTFNDPDRGLHTSLSTLNDGSLRAVETDPLGHLVTCLDNHPGAETAVAHQLLLTNGANGSAFATVDFDASGRRLTSPAVEMRERSLVCPRWTSDRATSVTSTPVIDDDFSTVAMHITDASASHTIAVDGCNLHATSVSPNDTFIAVNVTCYGERWADSGLYLLAMSKVTETNNLSDMQLVASGVFGRSAFHPDGTALAATRTEAIANQTAATDFNAADSSLAIFDLVTGDEQNLTLPHDAKAHSVAWLSQPAH